MDNTDSARRPFNWISVVSKKVKKGIIHLSSKGILKSGPPATATVGSVARRFHKEIGLPKTLSVRLSKKFNELAKKVDWAVSLPDGEPPTYAYTKRAKKSARRRSK